MRYEVKTIGYSQTVEADSVNEAVAKAFSERPPENVGMLIEIVQDGNKADPFYMNGVHAVELAGFPVNLD